MSFPINPAATSGFASSTRYDAHRPSYPPASVDALLSALRLTNSPPGARVLELGAGTGKFSALLAARPERFEILSVEPHAEMRRVLEGKRLEQVTVVEGSAERLGAVEDGWAETCVVAQAFHWFATMDALREIHKKMVPGGVLGMIWNIEDYNAPQSWKSATEWEARLKEIMWTFDDQQPRFRHEKWRAVFDEQLKTTPFTIQTANPLFSLPPGEHVERWTIWLSKEAVWERYRTISYIARLEGQELEETRTKVLQAMEGQDVEQNERGEVALHGSTVACWTSSIPG